MNKNTAYRNGSLSQHSSIRSNQIDEILERIWIFGEENPGNDCTPGNLHGINVSDIDLKEMTDEKLISVGGEKIALLDKGMERVRRIIRAHRLAECLLSEAFSFSEETMEKHACSFEHVLCQPVVDSVCTLLGHPRHCPHGKSIPAGGCCLEKANSVAPIVFPLSELDIESFGKIVTIFTQKHQRLDFLTSAGIQPGMEFFLERKDPVYVMKMDESRFAIEEEVARDILVRAL